MILVRPLSLCAAAALLALTGCSGDGDDDDAQTPTEVLASAKKQLDATSGVSLDLSTDELPQDVDGVLQAAGVATHAPAFDGSLKVLVNELTVDVPVVSVGGKVFAKLPFTSKYAEVDPGDYGAPDPALLMDPSSGISSWLTAAEEVKEGEAVRDGRTVLTSYTATVPGAAVAATIPSADEGGTFEVSFHLDEDDRLRSADISGPFYGEGGEVDYALEVTAYNVERDITRP